MSLLSNPWNFEVDLLSQEFTNSSYEFLDLLIELIKHVVLSSSLVFIHIKEDLLRQKKLRHHDLPETNILWRIYVID